MISQLSGCKGKIIFTLTTESFVDCRLLTKEPGNKLQNNGIDYYPHNQILISLRLRLDGSHLYPPSLEIWKFKTITLPPLSRPFPSLILLVKHAEDTADFCIQRVTAEPIKTNIDSSIQLKTCFYIINTSGQQTGNGNRWTWLRHGDVCLP